MVGLSQREWTLRYLDQRSHHIWGCNKNTATLCQTRDAVYQVSCFRDIIHKSYKTSMDFGVFHCLCLAPWKSGAYFGETVSFDAAECAPHFLFSCQARFIVFWLVRMDSHDPFSLPDVSSPVNPALVLQCEAAETFQIYLMPFKLWMFSICLQATTFVTICWRALACFVRDMLTLSCFCNTP